MRERGFGFVRGEDGHDYFLHKLMVADSPFTYFQLGDTVTFEPARGPRGLRAQNVKRQSAGRGQ